MYQDWADTEGAMDNKAHMGGAFLKHGQGDGDDKARQRQSYRNRMITQDGQRRRIEGQACIEGVSGHISGTPLAMAKAGHGVQTRLCHIYIWKVVAPASG